MTADLTSAGYWEASLLRGTGRLFMLAALADQPRHGYEIARRITALCGDCCEPSDAMIYPAIRDLEAAGLIACESEVHEGRNRRVCRLTESGREALAVAAGVWRQYLPALAGIVAAVDQGANAGAIAVEPACCPACRGGESVARCGSDCEE